MLCALPPVDVQLFKGQSLDEAKATLSEMGERLNRGNPWVSSDAKTKRLKQSLGFWKAIGANKTVLSFIGYGVPLRFAEEPPRLQFRNYRFCDEYWKSIEKEIASNLKDGYIREVSLDQAKVVNPITMVPKKGTDEMRMCMDARFVNAYLPSPKFKMETLQSNGADVIVRGNAQFTTDIKKAYYAIEMDEDAIPFLCFRHDMKVFCAMVMVFGLNIAPILFHKIMREVVKFLRALGINVLNFLDDFLWNETWDKIKGLIAFVRWLLPRLGWLFNDKCVWDASAVVTFLGMLVDAEKFQYRVPSEKIARARALIGMMKTRADSGEALLVSDLRSLTGTLMSYRLAVEPTRVWTRSMYTDIARAEYAREVVLSQETREELAFWTRELEKRNGQAIAHPLYETILQVDASEIGWGAKIGATEASGLFHAELIGTSSTRREMAGLRLATETLVELLQGKKLTIEMDSYAAIRNFINGGGPVPELCMEVKLWWLFCEKHKVTAAYRWIRRTQNAEADRLSKASGKQWLLRQDVQAFLMSKWNQPGTIFECPEFNCIGQTIRQAQKARQRMVLVYPEWPAQSWWLEVNRWAKETISLGKATKIFMPLEAWQYIGAAKPSWEFFASLLDFSAFLI